MADMAQADYLKGTARLVFAHAFMLVVELPLGLWYAFVTRTLWNWFAAPVFHSEVSFGTAWGLWILITYVFADIPKKWEGEGKEDDQVKYVIASLVSSVFSLLVGFGIHTFLH